MHALVYRELAKTDKSKKGTSTIISATARGKAGGLTASAPPAGQAATAPVKAKGKEKEKPGNIALTSPFTSAPLSTPAESISSGPTNMDVDDVPAEDQEVEEDEEEIVSDGDHGDDDIEEDDVQDTVALEEEELRKDAKGLDQPDTEKTADKMVEDV